MPDVVILRGASGSGKTTFAKRMPRVRISRDDLRRLLFGIEGKTVLTPEQEKKVTKFQREWIERELLECNDVVVDDTNLNKSLLKSLCRFINDIGFNFTIVDTKVSLEEAKARNARREPHDRVPEHVIDRQFKRAWWGNVESQAYVYKPYTPDPNLPAAFSFDLDGTLAHMGDRRGPYDFTKYHLDEPDLALGALTDYIDNATYVGFVDVKTLILTGRDAKYRAECEAWLSEQGVHYNRLIMRPEGDTRNDAVVKSDLWDEHIDGKFNVLMHYDDRNRVVNGLRRKGIKVAQVQVGDF